MISENEPLNPRQHQAIALLVQGMSQRAIARELSMSTKTIDKWLKDKAFQAVLAEQIDRSYQTGFCRIVALMEKATDKLEEILDNPKASCRDLLRAAELVLTLSHKYRQTDLAQKLEVIENKLDRKNKGLSPETAKAIREQILGINN